VLDNELRPLLSGLAGGLVSVALVAWLAKWMPRSFAGKSAESLRGEYRAAVWLSNAAFFSGLLGAIALYQWAGYAKNDWRPLALGAGFALAAPTLVLPVVALLKRGSPAEAFIAFALAQGLPPKLLCAVLALGWPLLGFAIAYAR
jgi:hypothetical protein